MGKLSKVKTIDIQAKQWFNKVNGNSYFAGVVTVNYGMKTEKEFIMPFQYGYGGQYEQEAFKLLRDAKLIPIDSKVYYLKDTGVIIRSSIEKGCLKRELMGYK